jgi:hypothetical protein
MALPLNLDVYGAIIAPGASLSASYTLLASGAAGVSPAIAGGVMMGADTLFGISMPASWVAASLTFQVSPDGGTTWQELYDDAGNEVTVTAAASQFIVFQSHPGSIWYGVNAIKVRSGTAGAPVVQTGGATVNLIGRPINY